MIYQIILFGFGAACVLGAPTNITSSDRQQPIIIPIVSQSEELESNGTYKFSYETGNGIKREETSYDKVVPKTARSHSSEEGGDSNESDEIHVQQGSYSYTAPDGTLITLRYIADENGFRPIGSHLPRAPSPISTDDKTARTLKQPDSESSGSIQSSVKSPSEETVPVVLSRSPAKPASLENKPADILPVDTVNTDESKTTTTATLPIKKTETTATSQTEQKTEVTESSVTTSTQSDKITKPTVSGSHASSEVTEESSTVAGSQSDKIFETTQSGLESTTEAKTDDSVPKDKTDSSTKAVTDGETSEMTDSTHSTSVATNEKTTGPSNEDTTLATTVSDNSYTEPSSVASTTTIDKNETLSTGTTAEITEAIPQETTEISTTTGAPSSEEVSTSSSSA